MRHHYRYRHTCTVRLHARWLYPPPKMHLCPFVAQDWLCHLVLSYFASPGAKKKKRKKQHHHRILSVQFVRRDTKSAFAMSRSVRGAAQAQEIKPEWQSAIHHVHHSTCEKKGDRERKKERHCILSLLWYISSLSLLISSALGAGCLFWGSLMNIFTQHKNAGRKL